jgi:hypothetical protein
LNIGSIEKRNSSSIELLYANAYTEDLGILIRSPSMPAIDDSGSALMAVRFKRGSNIVMMRVFSTPGPQSVTQSSSMRVSNSFFVIGLT